MINYLPRRLIRLVFVFPHNTRRSRRRHRRTKQARLVPIMPVIKRAPSETTMQRLITESRVDVLLTTDFHLAIHRDRM